MGNGVYGADRRHHDQQIAGLAKEVTIVRDNVKSLEVRVGHIEQQVANNNTAIEALGRTIDQVCETQKAMVVRVEHEIIKPLSGVAELSKDLQGSWRLVKRVSKVVAGLGLIGGGLAFVLEMMNSFGLL